MQPLGRSPASGGRGLSGTAANFEADNGGTPIANATSSTYTPVSGNEYLRAMVSYVYQFEIETDADAEDRKTGVSAVIPVQTSRENQAPKFKDGSSTFRVVAEDVVGIADDASDSDSDNIGSPVEATDANADMLTYTLSGRDASRFNVRANNGQLEVKAGANLDHETNASHTVTLMVDDGSGESNATANITVTIYGESNATANITVTIYVTDVDEAPKIRDRAASSANGERTVSYLENGNGPVARFTASDPEGAMPIVWSLTDEPVDDAELERDVDIADFDVVQYQSKRGAHFQDEPQLRAAG